MKIKKIVSSVMAVVMTVGTLTITSMRVSAADMPFTDVEKGKWYYDEIKTVYEKGLMTGTSETRFEPQTSLTRAMFITILGRLAGAEGEGSDTFPDTDKDTWYSKYVAWAVDKGIIEGFPD